MYKKKNNYSKISKELNNKKYKEEAISQKRLDLFRYYRDNKLLQKINVESFEIQNNPKKVNNREKIYNKNSDLLTFNKEKMSMSKEDFYQKYAKYNTNFNKKNELIYYTDKTLYNQNKAISVKDFQTKNIGFPNIGNSCYMNSFLQILLHTPNFLKTLIELNQLNQSEDTLAYNLEMLSKYPHNSDFLFKIKKIMGGINQKYEFLEPGDSQVFAIDFIDKLISEFKNDISIDSYVSHFANNNMSKIDKYASFKYDNNNNLNDFEKLFLFTEITQGAKIYNYTFSNNLHIELVFTPNINKISLYSLLNNKYLNNKINNKNIYRKIKVQIACLPEILIISFDRGVIGKNVIKTFVSFPEVLNLEDYIDTELKNYNKIQCTSYRLYAINERYGQYKTQGHYVCYIKINDWYSFSDLYVIQSSPPFSSQNVFGLYYIRNDLEYQ